MRGICAGMERYEYGMRDVGDGSLVDWEVGGSPAGKPAVMCHGGPGSGCVPGWRRYFNPASYRVVLFDQRGCGRSTPHASDPAVELGANTTEHLISDIEQLREKLGIARWLVGGVVDIPDPAATGPRHVVARLDAHAAQPP